MSDVIAYGWLVAGILLSVALPVAIKVLQAPPPMFEGAHDAWWLLVVKSYGKFLIASAVVGLILFAVAKYLGLRTTEWYECVVAGYCWDSTLQKFRKQGEP